jgi:hypothetical protein
MSAPATIHIDMVTIMASNYRTGLTFFSPRGDFQREGRNIEASRGDSKNCALTPLTPCP